MGLVTRQYNYVAGSIIVASQNNANENTLYNLVNGNLDADNFDGGALDESIITFDTSSGHDHDGSNSKKIDISGAGPMMQVTTTGTNHAIIGTSSSAGAHAGIRGVGSTSTALGGYFANTSSGTGLQAQADGTGVALRGYNANGAAGNNCIEAYHRCTTAGRAGVRVSEAPSNGYGFYVRDIEGVPLRIHQDGSSSTNCIEVVYASSDSSGANLYFERTVSGNMIAVGTSSALSTTGVDVLYVDTNRASGECINLNSQNASSSETLVSLNAAATVNTGEALGGTLGDMAVGRFLTDGAEALTIQGTASVAGAATGYVRIGSATESITSGPALRCYGGIQWNGDLIHDGSNVGFYNTTPASQQTVTGSRAGNAALANLLIALAQTGIVVDSTSP